MSILSFKKACVVLTVFAFLLAVAGSKAHAQSQESVEKANSIATVLIVSALVITTVAIILTVTKGDKKDKDGEKQDNPEKQAGQEKLEGQAWIESPLLSQQFIAANTCETNHLNWMLGDILAASVENAYWGYQGDCWRFAQEMK